MNKQLEPIEVIRTKDGTWMHPEFEKYMKEQWNNAEWISQEQWDEMKRYFNIHTTRIYMEGSVSSNAWESMMNSCNISDWYPVIPEGFFLVDLFFDEDDAQALIACKSKIKLHSELPDDVIQSLGEIS